MLEKTRLNTLRGGLVSRAAVARNNHLTGRCLDRFYDELMRVTVFPPWDFNILDSEEIEECFQLLPRDPRI